MLVAFELQVTALLFRRHTSLLWD